jgi:hypothetical protein
MSSYKKEFDRIIPAIITEAFIFTNFKPGELPDLKFYSPVVAWDTGAYQSTISMEVVEALQLKPIGKTPVMSLGGEKMVDLYRVSVGLPNGEIYHDVEAYGAELDEYAALFGMDIITHTDFLITNEDGKTTFQFRTPSEGGVEL